MAPEIRPEPLPPNENGGQQEEDEISESFTQDKYGAIQRQRQSEFKKHVHRVSIWLLYLVFLFYTAALISWLWHLLAPVDYHYMPMDNIHILQNLLFGTIVGGFASQFARKIFSD